MSLLYPSASALSEGYSPIVSPANSPLRLIEFGRLSLGGQLREYQAEAGGREFVVSVISGTARVEVEGQAFSRTVYEDVGGRRNLFSDLPRMVYLPRNSRFSISRSSEILDAVVVSAPSSADGSPVLIRDPDVVVSTKGGTGWTREVVANVGENVPASTLLVGECRTMAGQWGSYPPHKHDADNPPFEEASEEVYFFLVDPPQGFGIQRVYTREDDPEPFDEVYVVRNGDVIVIPRGYHPVGAAPGYRLCYTWAIAGQNRRYGAWTNDPNHEWILGLERG